MVINWVFFRLQLFSLSLPWCVPINYGIATINLVTPFIFPSFLFTVVYLQTFHYEMRSEADWIVPHWAALEI